MKSEYVTTMILAILLGACGTGRGLTTAELIRDCPEEKIVNRMPTVVEEGGSSEPNSYFIYNGERRELKEFDLDWIEANCELSETEVH